MQRGDTFAPIHWTGETAPCARIDTIIPGLTDPVSGQPESKAAAVSVTPYRPAWHGFAVSQKAFTPDCAYWARMVTQAGMRAELAGDAVPADWEAFARDMFGLGQARLQSVTDPARGLVRMAFWDGAHLLAAFFAGPKPVALMRDHISGLPGMAAAHVLSGRSPADQPDAGPMVCACFGVGMNTITAAIESGAAASVDDVGAALQAGTNCGSCRPEIAALIAAVRPAKAAEAAE